MILTTSQLTKLFNPRMLEHSEIHKNTSKYVNVLGLQKLSKKWY